MKPKTLTTHDLKLRGWTPAMIRDLLGPHDATRPSEMRVGSRNRVVDAQVKLYREDRVITAESTEKFARHQEAARARQDAAEKAQATKEAKHATLVAEYLATPLGLEAHPDAATMTQDELYEYHADLRFRPELELRRMLRPLAGHEAMKVEGQRHNAYLKALYALYDWERPAWMKEAEV